jgi:hypothetical protein
LDEGKICQYIEGERERDRRERRKKREREERERREYVCHRRIERHDISIVTSKGDWQLTSSVSRQI